MTKFTINSAFITGASSGIGSSFARQLAKPGMLLVLVARRTDRLQALASNLEKLGAKVEILSADLNDLQGIQSVVQKIRSMPELDLLINNAGFGLDGLFYDMEIERQAEMLRVHNEVPIRLTYAALPGMLAKKHGAIINTASIAAYTPGSKDAMYSATKAFLVTFSRALSEDLLGTGVKVQALCPGFTHTEFHEPRKYMKMNPKSIPNFLWQDADYVTRYSLNALDRNRVVVIPGGIYKFSIWLAKTGLIEIFKPIARRINAGR